VKLKTFLLLFFTTVLCGCATNYHSQNMNGGFSDTQLAPDTFRVIFRGNDSTSPERTKDFALLRCSDLTISNGFNFFTIVRGGDSISHSTLTLPGSVYTTGTATAYSNGDGTASGTYQGTSIVDPGEAMDIYRPTSGMLIKCSVTKPNSGEWYDANFLEGSIRKKYNLSAH
jgi:hypothetical protein